MNGNSNPVTNNKTIKDNVYLNLAASTRANAAHEDECYHDIESKKEENGMLLGANGKC